MFILPTTIISNLFIYFRSRLLPVYYAGKKGISNSFGSFKYIYLVGLLCDFSSICFSPNSVHLTIYNLRLTVWKKIMLKTSVVKYTVREHNNSLNMYMPTFKCPLMTKYILISSKKIKVPNLHSMKYWIHFRPFSCMFPHQLNYLPNPNYFLSFYIPCPSGDWKGGLV